MAENPKAVKLVHITTIPMSFVFLTGQTGYMKARGFEVYWVSAPRELMQRFSAQEQVPAYAVEMPRRIAPLRDLAAVFRIWRRLRQLRPQIVHAHTPKGGLLGMISAKLGRVPVRIYSIRGLPFMTASGYKRKLLWWSERIACLLAHQVFCVSRSLSAVAVKEGLCPAEKMKVLLQGSGNGVDAIKRFNPSRMGESTRQETRASYGIPADALVVGFVGRLVRDKGVVELAEAWKVLRTDFLSLHLLIVGPFEPQDPVPPVVEKLLRADPRIHLTGEEWNTPPLYAAMDVAALPTYREGFPNVPLEAAAMGLPVVATRIPGCVDAIQEGVTGTLVPPGDAKALTDAIRRYLNDPELRYQHGQAGRERVLRDFRQEDIWEAVYQEYIRLLRRQGFPVPELLSGAVAPSQTGAVS
jgi:glycosyltransferase involved in cell wall biosynthesis